VTRRGLLALHGRPVDDTLLPQRAMNRMRKRCAGGDDGLTAGRVEVCVFCSQERIAQALSTKRRVYAVRDLYPVAEWHILIIPLRHTPDFLSMTGEEKADALELIDDLTRLVRESDAEVSGFNIGMNCGHAAG
jgi:hypothetical protein